MLPVDASMFAIKACYFATFCLPPLAILSTAQKQGDQNRKLQESENALQVLWQNNNSDDTNGKKTSYTTYTLTRTEG